MGRGSLLMLAGLSIFFFSFFLVLTGFTLGVHLNDTLCLKELLFLSAISESYSELYIYIAERSFQATSPIPLSSRTLLDLLISIFLFLIYLAIWHNDFLMFLESDGRCSNEP